MTKSPLRSPDVKGVEDDPYDLNALCAAPCCSYQSDDNHHLFRRSSLGKPYWWVQVAPDVITGNVVGLCRRHHDQVTVDAAWITWEDGLYLWTTLFNAGTPLDFQPPIRLSADDGADDGVRALSEATQGPLDGTCPTCLRPLPHKHKREAVRVRRTWSLTVPKDERENGAETLDTLLEEARKELARAGLPYGDSEAAKFFVLASCLGLFVTHAKEVLG
jgi:hypothetical protein